MKTSKQQYKAILMKMEGCTPCALAASNLTEVLSDFPEYNNYVVSMDKEINNSIVHSYKIEMFPTVLILDNDSKEVERMVGAKWMTPTWWEEVLADIHATHWRQKVASYL